jgi:HAE1 family hydrophobic/amphiphilic exporter-1
LFTLGLDRFPRIDFPVISVITVNPGAAPQEIETEITDRIEGAVSTVSGIDEMRSVSLEGMSQVFITFDLAKDADVAAQEVRDKVDPILRELPETAERPIVQKLDPDAAPILLYAVSAPRDTIALTTLVEDEIQERLESLNGVGEVVIFGGRRREIHVEANLEQLRAYNLTVNDLAVALRAQNLELPGGRIDEGAREVVVRTLGRIREPEAFADLIVRTTPNGYPVRIRDVATVRDSGTEPRSAAMLDGTPAVVFAVRKQSGSNTVAVADAVRARVADILPALPQDVTVRLVRDQSEFIRASVAALEEHLILGGLFAAIVVFLFLWNVRSTIIAALAIPVSIIGAFALLAALDFTLNQMTMLALTLMIGIVIDDAIVVLENIYRFIEEKGLHPFQAAIEGTREIGFAVMATTLSLLAVFLPVGFMGGIVGRFMSSFGLTASAAVAISLLVAFTLTPMLAARWIKPTTRGTSEAPTSGGGAAHGHTSKEGRFYRRVDGAYTRMLEWSMAHRGVIVAVSVVAVVSIYPLFMLAGINFIPEEDESQFEITVRAPEGTSLGSTQSMMEQIARDVRTNLRGVESTLTVAGFGAQQVVNNGTIFVRLRPLGEREDAQSVLIAGAREIVGAYENVATSVQPVAAIGGGGFRNAGVQYVLVGPQLEKLDEYSGKVLEVMRQHPDVVDPDRSLLPGKPEIRVEIDRDRAADVGVRMADVSQAVNVLMAGQEVTTFNAGNDQYDVVLRAAGEFRNAPRRLREVSVRTADGATVGLENIVRLQEGTGPATIDRLDRERQVTLLSNVRPGGSQTDVIAVIESAVAGLNMDPGYRSTTTGQTRELQRAGMYFALAFALSFIFMYIVLAAQFESFIHPITILLTLPLAVPFGLLSTFIAGQRLNIFSALGVLLLFGVVKKNAILQIDHTNGLRRQGMERHDAIIQANRDRLRPILMTTLALVAGMVPLIIGSGPGAATNRSIGVLVAGGQSLCLLLTLLAVPVFYSLFEDLGEAAIWGRIADRWRRASRRVRALVPLGAQARQAAPESHGRQEPLE